MPTGTPFLRISNRTWFFPSNRILSKPDEPNPSRRVAIRLSETDGFYLRGNLSGVWLVVSPPLTHWREIKGWRTKIAPPFQQHVELGSNKKPPAVCFARVFGTKENDMSPVFLAWTKSRSLLHLNSCWTLNLVALVDFTWCSQNRASNRWKGMMRALQLMCP